MVSYIGIESFARVVIVFVTWLREYFDVMILENSIISYRLRKI